MNIYLLENLVNTGYDTYNAMVVCAPNQNTANQMHPFDKYPGELTSNEEEHLYDVWAKFPDDVRVTLLGTSNNPTQKIILRSFNAG